MEHPKLITTSTSNLLSLSSVRPITLALLLSTGALLASGYQLDNVKRLKASYEDLKTAYEERDRYRLMHLAARQRLIDAYEKQFRAQSAGILLRDECIAALQDLIAAQGKNLEAYRRHRNPGPPVRNKPNWRTLLPGEWIELDDGPNNLIIPLPPAPHPLDSLKL